MLQKQVRSILNRHKQRDGWFLTDYSVNPYEGCSCNCLYCYIRGSKYGANMDEGLVMKSNALEILEKQLHARAKKGQYGFVAVGSATDAYMHHEEKWKLTQAMLKLLLKYRFPIFISTKTALISRDVDLLKQIDETAILPADLKTSLGRGVILSTSVSSMEPEITKMLEPRAAPPTERLKILSQLKQQGFLTGVNAIPILPFISDTQEQLEKIIAATKQSGADYVLVGGLTLFGQQPADSKTLYFNFLKRYDPNLIRKYEALYGTNSFPPKHYVAKLNSRAKALCAKYDIRISILSQHGQIPERNTAGTQNKLF
ncbi:MAG: radical SAM protein [Bacteroidetes bacterium]|nr:MAG: radical SAM protein [Bacteroidota bacterium]